MSPIVKRVKKSKHQKLPRIRPWWGEGTMWQCKHCGRVWVLTVVDTYGNKDWVHTYTG